MGMDYWFARTKEVLERLDIQKTLFVTQPQDVGYPYN